MLAQERATQERAALRRARGAHKACKVGARNPLPPHAAEHCECPPTAARSQQRTVWGSLHHERQQLLHGYVHVTTEGTFGLKMGNLHLLLSQKQIDIPSCGLHYVQQTAVNESACGTPRADIITDP